MNHAPAIDIWKSTSRLSQFWEELAANYVTPDPVTSERIYPEAAVKLGDALMFPADEGISVPLETSGIQAETSLPATFAGEGESSRETTLLEKVGLESIQWIRHALETLTSSPEAEPLGTTNQADDLGILPSSSGELEEAAVYNPIYGYPDQGLTFIKVSSEPEPQPGSAIDTRRMAYGLKIPKRPLHKRPIYQRIFFCVSQMITRGSDGSSAR